MVFWPISCRFFICFLVFFCCSFVFLANLWDNQANFLPILSNLQVNHIELIIIYQAFLFPQNIQNANLGILPVYIFIYLYLTHTLLVPVEGIMTMIRAIKTDHDLDPECSPFWSHVI